MQLFAILSAATAMLGTALAIPAGKPTGGPASASVTIYSGPYTCTDPDAAPPAGSAGTAKTVTVTENACAIVNIPFGGAITSTLTASPKTGTAGCYIQIYTQSGCGVTLQNQYHGFPFNGLIAGSSQVGCANPPVQAYGAVSIVCA
ncbi:hypothetical protein BCR34DRAFT_585718 [Clohesyomyces aquaticus]|uniref:Uncharacterized protein n=1 Tax=Clohesyomyces aquaticus TaxID=1231657 RepID=A0A1Y1ZWC0_9PLEO|nr:hypothetical protein BCR34DRAFT_585718 [Clohesyomyces aquaticus]